MNNARLRSPGGKHERDYGRAIPGVAAKVCMGVFFGLATICVLVRIGLRLHDRRRLFLDDAFLTFALLCLCSATGILWMLIGPIFSYETHAHFVKRSPFGVVLVSLTWTTIFATKLSFLSFFRLLIRGVSWRLTSYFWIVVGISVASWLICVMESFVACRFVGGMLHLDGCKPSVASEVIPVLGNALDILTDMLILSIPILLLRKSQLRFSQKFGLCVLLCLSVVMALLAGIRASGFQFKKGYDVIWDLWWKYIEACVGCCMVSLSAFRSLFVPSSARAWRSPNRGPSTNARQHIWRQFKDPNRKIRPPILDNLYSKVSAMPAATPSRADSADTGVRAMEASATSFSVLIPMSDCPEGIEPPRLANVDGVCIGDQTGLPRQNVSATQGQRPTIEDAFQSNMSVEVLATVL